MEKNTVAEELIYQLAELGVERILGITGDAMNGLTDALRRDGRISWYTVRHEETAAFASAAQAELTQALAVCVGTIGPGALHLINGLYNAKRDRAPVLVLTGEVPQEEIAAGYFQEVDQIKAFDDVCVFSQVIRTQEQIPRLIKQAVEAALTYGGVAHIAIPTDLATATLDHQGPITVTSARYKKHWVPAKQELESISATIANSKRPAILIGAGTRGYRNQVHQLAEKLRAPVVHSLKATEVLPYDNPYSIGGLGHVGTPHGLKVMDECDCLLMLGTDFPYSEFLPHHGNVIQIDVNPRQLGHRCRIRHGLVGDVGSTLENLVPELPSRTADHWLQSLQDKRDRWMEQVATKYAVESQKAPMAPQSIVLKLSELASEDAIFVADVGEVTVWAARHLRMHSNQRLIGSFSHGSLGVGLPAAIGAKAQFPERQVIALCGDGAFSMMLGDLATAAFYELNLVAIVFNNQKFGFVELEMEAAGLPRFATDLYNPHYANVAEAHHCMGIRVEDPSELTQALQTALNADKPTVVEVMVNPGELIIPPKIDLTTAWKFTAGKIRELVLERSLKDLF